MSRFLSDYIAGVKGVRELFSFNYLDLSDRKKAVVSASKRSISMELLSELEKQNQGCSAPIDNNLQRLSTGPVACVVTGQQLGLFGGPIFTLYKIMSAIKLASELERESGISVVPVFWAQTEDHDYKEIGETSFLLPDEEIKKLSLDFESSLLGDSVGSLVLEVSVLEKMHSVWAAIQTAHEGKDPYFSQLTDKHYRSASTLSKAFCGLIRDIFSRYGLIVVDAHQPGIKRLWISGIKKAIFEGSSIDKLLQENLEQLKNLGFSPQVTVRSGSPLLFVSISGKRQRFTTDGSEFLIDEKRYSKNEMDQLIEAHPESFTCSALIRPIFQDTLFPTAAYVAGQAEFSYWAQIKGLYSYFGLSQPMVVPRVSFVVSEPRYERLCQKASVSITDLNLETKELLSRRLKGGEFDSELIFPAIVNSLSESLRNLGPKFEQLDARLKESIEKTVQGATGNIEKLRQNYERALAQRETTLVQQIERLKRVYYPDKVPQERVLNFGQYLMKYGEGFLQQVYDQIEMFEAETRTIYVGA